MGKSVLGKLKNLIPPRVIQDLPPYIPRSFPPMQTETVEENTEPEELQVEENDQSPRDKRQAGSDTQSKTTYCDGVDEIGCYQVFNSLIRFSVTHITQFFRFDCTMTGFLFLEVANAGKIFFGSCFSYAAYNVSNKI